jgi:hypothetical protein
MCVPRSINEAIATDTGVEYYGCFQMKDSFFIFFKDEYVWENVCMFYGKEDLRRTFDRKRQELCLKNIIEEWNLRRTDFSAPVSLFVYTGRSNDQQYCQAFYGGELLAKFLCPGYIAAAEEVT